MQLILNQKPCIYDEIIFKLEDLDLSLFNFPHQRKLRFELQCIIIRMTK